MKNLNNFLKSNPDILSKYVSIGLTIVDKAVAPLNGLMKHLMEVQGIDPNTQPGSRVRRALEVAVGQVDDPKDFDSDFNFSRFYSKFEKAKQNLDHLNLTKDQYRRITDLSKIDDVRPALIPQSEKKIPEIRLYEETKELPHLPGVKVKDTTLNPLEDLAAYTGQSLKTPVALSGNIDIKSLKNTLQELKKIAEGLDLPKKVARVEDSSRPVEIKDGTRV